MERTRIVGCWRAKVAPCPGLGPSPQGCRRSLPFPGRGWRARATGGEGESWEDYLTKEERLDGSSHFRFVGGLKSGRLAKSKRRVHFVGIGGAGLSNLAKLALARGWMVTGSDITESARLESLRDEGALVDVGHQERNVLERAGVDCLPDAMVVSSAVSADNVEVRCALKYNIPLYKRGAWLGRVTSGYSLVSVAGTHGKTTTTAMLALVLDNFEPEDGVTAIVGGDLQSWDGGSRVGASNYFVLEADEYDRAFLDLQSKYAMVTNVELDHLDIYESEDDLFAAFEEFLDNVSREGGTVICGDDPGCRALIERRNKTASTPSDAGNFHTYGFEEGNDWRAVGVVVEGSGETSFRVEFKGVLLERRIKIPLLGAHNVLNALGVIALAAMIRRKNELGPQKDREELEQCVGGSAEVLQDFEGVERRCQVLGEKGRSVVVSDYAHHPTEVQATLEAIREHFVGRKLVVVFEPHTLSRLAYFFSEFSDVLSQCSTVYLTRVFEPIKTYISAKVKNAIAEDLAGEIGLNARYIVDSTELVSEVVNEVERVESVVLVMGAGLSHSIAMEIFDRLRD